ncbi:MAG TPA: 1,2-phenylacetyl-CoA epoxidase subunit PaaC [Candidatus Kapabacteria bacterium]|nr:1,2-phenylacetyl-CoA epoxidase subunit PaaC [Candidatus Kapabacteria bacterium]
MSNDAAVKDLLFRMADDDLIIAHRNSEWTGLGPIMEEDIAFSSIAQDKLGHSLALYTLLQGLGEAEPDTTAFTRDEAQFRCCHLVEYPIGGYDFSLMRHFLFDMADMLRFEMLESSSFEPLAKLAAKVRGEIKYHVFHAATWVEQLGAKGNEESHARMQSSLNQVYPLALGIFEPSQYEAELAAAGIFAGEAALQEKWAAAVAPILERSNLRIPSVADPSPAYGGRRGYHTEHLQPMLTEMTEVFRIDPTASW